MTTIDPAAEYRQLKEVYKRMTEEELAHVADEAYQLTDTAKQTLAGEISRRGLNVQLKESPPKPTKQPHASGFAAEDEMINDFDPADLELAVLRRMWDLQEAQIAKGILDEAGIPSYFGDENLECAGDVSAFEAGVDLKVCSDDAARAMRTLVDNWPNCPENTVQGEAEENTKYAVKCPRCKSAEVIFLERDGALTGNSAFNAKFKWTCDRCGHEWEDDGIEQKV